MRFLTLLVLASALVLRAAPAWDGYKTILWLGDSAWKDPAKQDLVFQRLAEMGINSGMVTGDENPAKFVDRKMPYYVENIVNKGLCLKWSSEVKDWNAFISNWAKNGRKQDAMVREYCFDDPKWLDWAKGKMVAAAKVHGKHEPLLYDLRDELSVTISANPFDYDFSPLALAAFREWLKGSYGSIEKLNTQWETKFSRWEEVMPFTTDQIKNRMSGGGAQPRGNPDWQALAATKFDPVAAAKDRTRWNFAPWSDHRSYMDFSLARTLDSLRQAAKTVDPKTPVGIEGTQTPSAFGGYDLWQLSQSLDWMEPYDIGNAREIFGSFMPGKTLMTTVGEKSANPALRRLWHLVLEGDRGCIVWWSEDSIDWKKEGYPLTEKGTAMAGVLKEMTSPVAAKWIGAERQMDDVAILYSQPSLQVGWLLESTGDGSTWQRRFSSYEADHNQMAKVRDGWLKAVQDLGYSPRFISSQQLVAGANLKKGSVLILPQCLALGDEEIKAIQAAKTSGVVVLSNGSPGAFDAHGTLRAAAPFDTGAVGLEQACALSPAGAGFDGSVAEYPKQRASGGGAEFSKWLKEKMPVPPAIAIPSEAKLRVYRHRKNNAQLVAVERGIAYAMSEDLSQAGGNEALEKPVQVTLKMPAGFCYDVQTGKLLGNGDVKLTVEPWRPTLLAIFAKEVADPLKALE